MLRLFSFPAVYTFVKTKYGDEPQFTSSFIRQCYVNHEEILI